MRVYSWIIGLFLALAAVSVGSAQAFSDLPENHHHYFPMSLLEFEGIIQGYPDGTVRPDQLINRAELVKILVEGLGFSPNVSQYNNCFPDVKDEWFAPFICFAKEKGWIGGYPDGTFRPGQTLNKAEALKIILNAFAIPSVTPRRQYLFEDTAAEDWYAPFLSAAVQKNLIEEIGGPKFNATNPRSRGEVALMVARIIMMQKVNDAGYTPLLKAEFQNYLYIHKLRRENGVNEKLKINPVLTQVARAHAKDMGDNIKSLSHASSDGVTQSYDRIKDAIKAQDDANFSGRTGENIGGGSSWATDPYDVVKYVHDNIFMPEDPNQCNHRTTLLSQCLPFTEIGIGVYVSKENQTFFVNDFITREYAKVAVGVDNSQLQPLPEYTGSEYVIEKEGDDYTVVKISNCNQKRVRLKSLVDVMLLDRDGQCEIQERALGTEVRKYPSNIDYQTIGVFYLTYSTVFYGNRDPSSGPYIILYPGNKWDVTSHQEPYYFELGSKVVVDVKSKDGTDTNTYELDFSEDGFVNINQL